MKQDSIRPHSGARRGPGLAPAPWLRRCPPAGQRTCAGSEALEPGLAQGCSQALGTLVHRPARPGLPGTTRLPHCPGRWFSCSREPVEQSLRSQLHQVTWFCCVGCSISSRSSCSDDAATRGPTPLATRPGLASSFLTGLQPLHCLPASRLNSPSPSRPLPVVLWAVRPVRQPGSAGPAHRLSLVSKGPAGWWLWPHQSAGSVLHPEPQPPPLRPGATS